jgi:signal transduction histidine kinase
MCDKAFGGITTESESAYQLRDGSYRYFNSLFKPARNHKGEIEAVIITARDITEKKMAEKESLKQEVTKQKIMSQAIIDTQENERTEIGKELHDNVNQVLSTIKLYLEMAKTNTDLKDALIEKSIVNVNAVIDEIRRISTALMSYSISELGLVSSITELAENINMVKTIRVEVDVEEFNEGHLGDNQKIMFFRIVQEALNNIIKHSFATSVLIQIRELDNKIQLTVKDNGKGFDVNHTKKGIGVYNIQNRVSMFNGSLLLNSAPGKGCELKVEIPLRAVGNQ